MADEVKLVMKCKICIHWKDRYHNASHNDTNWMAGYCKSPNQKSMATIVTGEDYSCVYWESEQRTGDEVV